MNLKKLFTDLLICSISYPIPKCKIFESNSLFLKNLKRLKLKCDPKCVQFLCKDKTQLFLHILLSG